MRRCIKLMFAILLASTISVLAQPTIGLDIEAGPNFSTFSAPESSGFESEMQSGTHIGVYVRFENDSRWSFWGGPAFSEVNFNRTYDAISLGDLYNEVMPGEINLSYSFKIVEFPAGITYTIPGEFVDVGFLASVRPALTSGHESERYSQRISENNFIQFEIDMEEQIRSFGLFVEPGIEFRYKLDEDTKIFGGMGYAFDTLGLYEANSETRRLHRIDLKVGLSIRLF